MTTGIEWVIPPSTLRLLASVPEDVPVAVLLRHSVRPPLPELDSGHSVPITEDGVRLARRLGSLMGLRLRSLHASPLIRCVQTASALAEGAGLDLAVEQDRLLGDPGCYVLDGRMAFANWKGLGHEEVMARLVGGNSPLPGMAAPEEAARFLVHHMLAAAGARAGLHVFVTHDSLVTATAARLLREPLGRAAWPWYLEGAFFWREGQDVHVAYREGRVVGSRGDLCGLVERDVVEFARREAGLAVGLDCSARYFLAGGAFKTLLTGRPPRDLDFWTRSPEDRDALIQTLLDRGARLLAARPFADAFEIRGRVVEVARRAEPRTLEEQIGRSDIGLSMVGAECQRDGRWRCVIHPLALESLRQKAVLLQKPLVNWKYALTTLERLRRYASELDYAVPEEEIAEVWRTFDAQAPEMQQGMLERFDRTTQGDNVVREEAVRRLRSGQRVAERQASSPST